MLQSRPGNSRCPVEQHTVLANRVMVNIIFCDQYPWTPPASVSLRTPNGLTLPDAVRFQRSHPKIAAPGWPVERCSTPWRGVSAPLYLTVTFTYVVWIAL
jgi:hypothetical protein